MIALHLLLTLLLSTTLTLALPQRDTADITFEDKAASLQESGQPSNLPRLLCPTDSVYACRSDEKICSLSVCDGIVDCADGSDEIDCGKTENDDAINLPQNLCPGDNYYVCASGDVICDVNVCDGVTDCPDWDDEESCECKDYQFLCDGTRCVSVSLMCDGIQDCLDRTDEKDCNVPNVTTTDTTTFPTTITTTAITNTIPTTAIDTNTTTSEPLTCPTNEAPRYCHDGKTLVCFCDGVVECPRGEDEKYCQHACRPEEWRCRCDGSCISKRRICDHRRDCPDGSDEHGCVPGHRWWRCRRGGWILLTQRCDGLPHCSDASDEHFCRHHHHCHHGHHQLLFLSLLQHKVKQLYGFIED